MFTLNEASLLVQLIEVASESNWPRIRDAMLERGWQPAEIIDATNKLCRMAHISEIICKEDF